MEKLAINGGPKAKTTPNIHMFPGGMEIGEEERNEVLEVLDHKYLFRYYGPEDFPSKVRQLEVDFAKLIGTKHALAVNSCTSALSRFEPTHPARVETIQQWLLCRQDYAVRKRGSQPLSVYILFE